MAFYGDDFTGSTDALEALACAGLPTVLFVDPPSTTQLARFPNLKAFGIAGGSRAMSPAQMERHLPVAFAAIKASGAPIVHYKTCSTFDSSPKIGSIGKAIELGRRVFGDQITPLVPGAPALGRYVAFGNLFASPGSGLEPVRLDRHPTMSRHPVTPMDEADLRAHLSKQTRLPVRLVNVLRLEAAHESYCSPKRLVSNLGLGAELRKLLRELSSENPPPILLFDTLLKNDLFIIGCSIAALASPHRQLFCAGSRGVVSALVEYWRTSGLLPQTSDARFRRRAARGQLICISGSSSPVTDCQIQRAVQAGFVEISCDSALLADVRSAKSAVRKAIVRAGTALDAGRNVIFHTTRGARDARQGQFRAAAERSSGGNWPQKLAAARDSLGRGLGHILEEALARSRARRIVICGGDTSTLAARELGLEALEFLSPAVTGAPVCRAHASGRVADHCEIICKGGQTGGDNFFPVLAGVRIR